ncbi:FecR family protein [Paraflavitalea pollutisoli]|uniref:FecR family protein n=1 Tax=Paraflavitalea pollutisoli TaxID=3034143 RepID=UPI0023ED74F6|nr:FecR domain-containing protein [Paraflavitalea sp. H1-2-19X]
MSDQQEKDLADRISLLIQKYHNDSITDDELAALEQIKDMSAEHRAQIENLMTQDYLRAGLDQMSKYKRPLQINYDRPAVEEHDIPAIPVTTKAHSSRIYIRMAVAASLVAAAFLAWYFILSPKLVSDKVQYASAVSAEDVLPAATRARLVLSTGEAINLDSQSVHALANEGDTRINLTGNGQLEYLAAETTPTTTNRYNTVTVPKGGVFNILLADGTKVWLNNDSELKFPVSFTGTERRVILSGEAFFEVAKNAQRPFVVELPDSKSITVLGTVFNTRAYKEEKEFTTSLVEGSVQLSSLDNTRPRGSRTLTLRPGQEATQQRGTTVMTARTPRLLLDSYSWRTGLFHFEDEPIQDVMNQVARWYNISVVYEGSPPKDIVSGDIYRTLPLASVLASLSKITHATYEWKAPSSVIVREKAP